MNKRTFLKFFALTTGSLALASSTEHGASASHHSAPNTQELQEMANKMFAEVISQNDYYVNHQGSAFFEKLKNSQHPRATIIGCSDSRFQSDALDKTAENDLFIIRNIGNQFSSNMGSVEYGIRHLNTPLLIIVGHSRCGAIKAALSDYSAEGPHIIQELDSLSLAVRKTSLSGTEEAKWLSAVISNVHQQAYYAQKEFKADVESGKLTIVGVVYDLANDFNNGYGRLKIVNINGETNPEKIMQFPLMKSLFKPVHV
ncbi:MAG: carbonic anhydrase [Sulfuricurvum sp.]|uniref:carbonic anhydrase n=1 Tax=Sulfuricurvum sp. TaxID=2025608 RepID=UPI0027368E6C|nr:carbonic anhydrase [Sulfuricurvum sp.]MDP2849631.1 carbonic anhydrase [Sulfuricurvum sp.]